MLYNPMVRTKSVVIETATHIAHTCVPIYSQQQWLAGAYLNRVPVVLGVRLKPRVRVKMGRAA